MARRINFASANQIVDEGTYAVTVIEAEEVTTKAGEAMDKLRLRIDEGPFADKLLFTNVMLEGKGMFKLLELCDALKIDYDIEDEDAEWDEKELIGMQMIVKVSVGEYNKRPSNSVDQFLPFESRHQRSASTRGESSSDGSGGSNRRRKAKDDSPYVETDADDGSVVAVG